MELNLISDTWWSRIYRTIDYLHDFRWNIFHIIDDRKYAFWQSKRGQALCEWLGHDDVWWYAYGDATEPDMHCKTCGKNLA